MKLTNKRFMSLFLSIALILGILIIPAQNKAFAAEAKVKKLTIVHTNDIHGRIKEDKYDGMGFGKLETKLKELKSENSNLILLNAGDTVHGLPIVTISRGEAMVKLMNEMSFDAMVPGNHDFNYGTDRLLELKDIAEFPMLAANVVKGDGTNVFKEYVIKEVDGLKIGIFGLATEETKHKANPKYTEGIFFKDPIKTAQQMVLKLEKEEVDMIVALTHIGIDEESDPTTIDIANKVTGIDLIVDGHSHSKLDEGKLVNDTLIVQAGEYLKNVGIVNVEFTDGKITKKEAKLFTKEEAVDVKEDEKIMKLINELEEKDKPVMDAVIGEAKVKLDGEREIVRTKESNLGNLLADAMLDLTKADVAITNGGGIRTSIEAGPIKKGHVLTAFPFANYTVVIEVKGIDIINALENGLVAYPETAGAFPQVGGMTFKFDPTKEAGNKVYDLMIQGKPVDLNRTYKLATNDFMAAGGDKYEMFIGKSIVGEYEALNEMLIDYIQKIGELDIKVEGRSVPQEGKKDKDITVVPTEVKETKETTAEVVTVETKQETSVEKYNVKSGDTLWKIGKVFNTTWQKLAEFNKISNPHLIFPGQQILIPAK